MAVLVVQSRVADTLNTDPLLDLQYRLIHADDAEAAYRRALELGQLAAQSYQNEKGQLVTWECVGLHDLREVLDAELSDGVEVYNQIIRRDPKSYLALKEQLTVFWAEVNKHRTADELLGDS